MDEALRARVLNILNEEQNQFKTVFNDQTTATSPQTIQVVSYETAADGRKYEKITEEPSNYVQPNVDKELRQKVIDKATDLRAFCKIIDDKIISINVDINTKKSQIITLSTEANNGNCWPGIAYSSTTAGGSVVSPSGVVQSYRSFIQLNNDIENLRIYPNIAGPQVNYNVENPFEPDTIYQLTPSYSGYGYRNLQDTVAYRNKDGTLTGSRTDGSGVSIGSSARFDLSTTLSDHQARSVGSFRYYAGAGVAPYASDTGVTATRCVAIANSISSIYSEILSLRVQRDSLRTDLNTIKQNKSEKEVSAWGMYRTYNEVQDRQTRNISAIAAVQAFDANDLVGADRLVLFLDASKPDSYPGVGTAWNDISGYGFTATLLPTVSPPAYDYKDGGSIKFNGTSHSADTIARPSTSVLGVGNTWTMEAWFKLNGPPSDTTLLNTIVDVNASGSTSNMIGVSFGTGGDFTGIATNRFIYASRSGAATQVVVGSAGITTGSWYHGVVVRNDTSNTKLYLNGVGVATFSGNISSGTTSTTFTRLAQYTDATSYGNMNIAVVKIYQKSFTDVEIQNKFIISKSRFASIGTFA
jgi:hypothetical protein